jgi:hypothetical protein
MNISDFQESFSQGGFYGVPLIKFASSFFFDFEAKSQRKNFNSQII